MNPLFILRAFEKGADGVILCGCHPGDCHYSTGNYYARRRMTMLFSMLDYLGVERARTRVEWVSAAEGAKFSAVMNSFCIQNLRAWRKCEIGGSEMQEIEKLCAPAVRSCLRAPATGFLPGRRASSSTIKLPPCLPPPEKAEKLCYDSFCGASLSKYLIEKAAEGKTCVLLKPCDTYSLQPAAYRAPHRPR